MTLPSDDGIVVVKVEKGGRRWRAAVFRLRSRGRLGDDATFGLIELLDSERKEWSEHVLSVSADRFERRLTEEISALRVELRQALHDGLLAVRQELAIFRQELATSRVEMLKWSFVFWIGQVAAIAALLAVMFRITGR